MKQPQFIIKQQLDVLRTYISEHGQQMGNVSWQMADTATNLIEESVSRLVMENEEKFLAKILGHSFRQGEYAAFHLLAKSISGRDERREAIDVMFDETIEENKRNIRNMLALFRRQLA